MSMKDIMLTSFFNTLEELESDMQKTAAEERYRPKVQALLYTPDGKILASKSQAGHTGNNYKFPGGGIEEGESLDDATKKELLEEAGWTTSGNAQHMGSAKIKWDKAFREFALKKGRDFHGEVSHFMAVPAGQRDNSKFGSEGDALHGADFVHIDDLIKDLGYSSKDKTNQFRKFDKAKLEALTKLRNSGMFTKKASHDESRSYKLTPGEIMKRISIGKELAEQIHDMSKSIKAQKLQNSGKMKDKDVDAAIEAINSVRKAVKR